MAAGFRTATIGDECAREPQAQPAILACIHQRAAKIVNRLTGTPVAVRGFAASGPLGGERREVVPVQAGHGRGDHRERENDQRQPHQREWPPAGGVQRPGH